ncbi:MAG TPA: penicillin acylase family protein [Pyrinomonadaceae bacterium]|nr:penicillin acylase family protein [Pyrinomonadaceae bacterium]
MFHKLLFNALMLVAVGIILRIPADAQTVRDEIVAPNISAPVLVRRDSRSVPFIEARNDRDLYFVQGWVTASDRLWQMDLLRRVARGQTAEIFGRQALEEDKVWRRYGFAAVAEKNLEFLSPELKQALDSYAAGVNAYIRSLSKDALPTEFKILQYQPSDWRSTDSILIGKILAEALSSTWRQDLVRAGLNSLSADKLRDITNRVTPYDVILFGSDVKTATTPSKSGTRQVRPPALEEADRIAAVRERSLTRIGLYAEDLAASNNWVISGKLTRDGKPILANDPHLAATAPGIWYISHLSTPAMRVSGVTFPGVPGIILGHNSHFAWGATNVGPDVQDLYEETVETNGSTGSKRYKTASGWEKLAVRNESILVRSSPLKTDTETVELEVLETRNGPIILTENGKTYSMKWTANDPKNSEFEAFFRLNRSQTWEEFRNALSSYGGATQNFVYADTKGNIGWQVAGSIPLRRTGHGEFPYDGSTNEGEWIGTIPFAELPFLYNPPSGLIITANQRIVGTDYKYPQMVRDAAPPWRARRLYDLLSGKRNITLDQVSDAQHDIYNIPFSMLAAEIVSMNTASSSTISELKKWDGRMTAESRPAVLINEIRNCLANRIAEVNKPAPAAAIRERILFWAIKERSARWLPPNFKDHGEFVRACDESSRGALSAANRLGADESKWRWDAVFRARFMHPLAAAPLIGGQFLVEPKGVSGSGQTPNVGAFVSMRHIASPGNWDATRLAIPLGQSGNNQSPHFRDQFEAWNTGKPALLPFSETAVKAAAVRQTEFRPAPAQ